MSRVRTCLAYEADAEAAAQLYVSLVAGSRIENIFRTGPSAPPLVVDFTLGGAPYQSINAGVDFGHTMGASISITTPDQEETDRLWNALIADGGAESRCGWLIDRWGVAWQIIPDALVRTFSASDRKAAARAREAMMTMSKIDVAAIEAAFDGN